MSRDRVSSLIALAVLLAGLALAWSNRAEAGSAVVNWTNPVTKADGTPLAVISGTRVEWGTCLGSAFGTLLGSQSTTGVATSTTVLGLPAGTYCFRAFTLSGALVSGPSNVGSKVIPDSPPNPPVLTTITAVAYEVRGGSANRRMVAVGSVALGEVCGKPWVRDGRYARLQPAQVTITGRYLGGRLFGVCA
jgi:hypothetical protein